GWHCYVAVCHPDLNRFAYGGEGPIGYIYDWRAATTTGISTRLDFISQMQFIPGYGQIILAGEKSLESWSTDGSQCIFRWSAPHGKIVCVRIVGQELLVAWG